MRNPAARAENHGQRLKKQKANAGDRKKTNQSDQNLSETSPLQTVKI